MRIEIRDITFDDLRRSVAVIRESFATVAQDMAIDESSCPAHPSFISLLQLEELRVQGLRFFGLFAGDEQVGFIAVEQASDDSYYLEKLAVIPSHRHKGFGSHLIEFAHGDIRRRGGKRVSVAIIHEHVVLKRWYHDLGFRETHTKRFEHLPFTVCFMEKHLD